MPKNKFRNVLSRLSRPLSRTKESLPTGQSTSAAVALASQSSHLHTSSLCQANATQQLTDHPSSTAAQPALAVVSEHESMPALMAEPAQSPSSTSSSYKAVTLVQDVFKTTLVLLHDALDGVPLPGKGAITATIKIIEIAEVSSFETSEYVFLIWHMT